MAPEIDQTVFSWSNFLFKLSGRQVPKQFVRSFHVGLPPAEGGVDERLLCSHLYLPSIWTNRMSQPLPPCYQLDLGSAAVNEQFNTRDETRVLRSQKQRRLRNFLGFPHASHRDGGHNPRNHVWSLPTHHWRTDRTRTASIDKSPPMPV